MQNFSIKCLLVAGIFVLSACGSSDDAATTTPVVASNTSPTLTDPGTVSVLEGATAITTIVAVDTESGSNGVTQTISGGVDSASFAITEGGVLTFAVTTDFETPADSDGDNVYEITLLGTDQAGATGSLDLSITVTDAIEGRIIDGPLSGAQVFIDLNDNGALDEGEDSVTSNATGFFTVAPGIAEEGKTKKIISIGGTDTKTGKELPKIALISVLPEDPSKPVSVTPLSTIISSASTPEEQAKVLTALGISGTVDELLTTDTWALAEAGDETAQDLQRKNQQIGLILQTAESLVGDDATSSATDVTKAVAAQIVELTTSNETVDLTSTAIVTEVLSDTIATVDTSSTVSASSIAAVAGSVAEVNTVVADPTIDPTGDTAKEIADAAQTTLQDSVESLAAGTTDTAAFETATETSELLKEAPSVVAALDLDEDGISDVLDADDDGDGVADVDDAFSRISLGTLTDTDGDGRPNDCDATCQSTGMTADTDDDADGVLDTADALPLLSTESVDTDSDGIGNNADSDDDGDGVADASDFSPLDAAEWADTDGDGIGDKTDTDDDGDGIADADDPYPLIVTVVEKGSAGRAGLAIPDQVKVLETE